MAYSLVVVLLLDTITDFPAGLDKIVHSKNFFLDSAEKCDLNIEDSILTTAKREFGLNIQKIDTGIETHLDDKTNGNFLANEDYEFVNDNSQMNNIHKDSEFFEEEFNDDNAIKSNETLSTLPETPPFLVAIFETLSNVTANTCAGTLLTPFWVLTSTSCINVLDDLRKNGTNMTEPSIYTVIAEASNPLVDGTAHNVTNVVFPPGYQTSNTSRRHTLVMMNINPGVEGGGLDMMGQDIPLGLNAEAFGWVNLKNDSNPLVKCLSIPVKAVPRLTCGLNNTSLGQEMCLSTIDNKTIIFEDVSKLSWGSPVLQVRHRRAHVLAVTHAGERALPATPVYPHTDWIQAVITNNTDNIRTFKYLSKT